MKVEDTEHFIDRSQIVRIAFRTVPPQIRDSRGGQYDAETEEERANPDIPEQFIAEIYTTDGGDPVYVTGDEARRLYAQLNPSPGARRA